MGDKNHKYDPLEELFRKKMKEYDISYREQDWAQLEHQLDLQDARIAYRRKLTWLSAAAAILFSVFGYFTYQNHLRLNEMDRQYSDLLSTESHQPEGITPEAPELPTAAMIPPGREWSFPELMADLPAYPLAAMDDHPEPVTEEPEMRLTGYDLHADVTPASIPRSTLPPMTTQPVQRQVDQTKEEHPADYYAEAETPIGEPPRSRLALGVTMAPDISSAGSVSAGQSPGYKAGLMLEYQITSRFSVSTGLVQSKVRYGSDSPADYSLPAQMYETAAPDGVTGQCLILDVPISLKYNVFDFERYRVYATAGLSSYIMLDEAYTFSYDDYDSPPDLTWSDRTGTRHWFSNAGFSVGLERDLHPNWSLRAEPFIRLPLSEVGQVNVRLYSIGSFFSVNYRL